MIGATWFEKMVGSPIVQWTFGAVSALLLASLAAAGMNTLLVARLLLVFAWAILGFVIFATTKGRTLPIWTRIAIALGVTICFVIIERWETAKQPESYTALSTQRFPRPPLLLMFPPAEMLVRHVPVRIEAASLLVDYLHYPLGGYASFTAFPENDDVMLGIDNVFIQNLSDKMMRLTWSIRVMGEGRDFVLSGDGKGRWQRKLNVNDYMARKGGGLGWLLPPVDLPPGKQIRGTIGFVAPAADQSLRELIAETKLDERYSTTLRIRDVVSERQVELQLPFGNKPVPDEALRARYRRPDQATTARSLK